MGKGKRLHAAKRAEQYTMSKIGGAIRQEVSRQVLDIDRQYRLDMDAAVLWALHEAFGFGRKRLKRFFDAFSEVHTDLRKAYSLSDDDVTPKCRELLKSRAKVDLVTWETELEKKLIQDRLIKK